MRVDNTLFRTNTKRNLTLSDDSTVEVWVLPDRAVTLAETTDGSRPHPRAYKIADATTASGSIRGCLGRTTSWRPVSGLSGARWSSNIATTPSTGGV